MEPQSRQEFVRAAISFLQNPKLVESPLKEKLRFLKDKGLSDLEVDEALNLALIQRNQSQSGKWNFLLILGLCVGGYKLYQAYVEQHARKLEEEKGQQHGNTHERLTSGNTVQKDVTDLDGNQPTLGDILQRMSELKKLIELQRTNFKTEVQSLKTLMLGHEKFAAPPKIPEWQLSTTDVHSTKKLPASEPALKQDINKKSKGKSVQSSAKHSSSNSIIEPTELTGSNPG